MDWEWYWVEEWAGQGHHLFSAYRHPSGKLNKEHMCEQHEGLQVRDWSYCNQMIRLA